MYHKNKKKFNKEENDKNDSSYETQWEKRTTRY